MSVLCGKGFKGDIEYKENFKNLSIHLAPVVEPMDSTIRWINHHPVDVIAELTALSNV